MLNRVKTLGFMVGLLLSTSSLATKCAPGDTDCALNQKKMKLMDEMGIKPVATQDQPMPMSDEDKKPQKPFTFQIPSPGNSQSKTNQPSKIQINPGLKIFAPATGQSDNNEKQESGSQQQTETPKPIKPKTGIIYR